jgi:NET1-associated nuclear protein 1 (U3 small nucleolar RNA-associated protein 17)
MILFGNTTKTHVETENSSIAQSLSHFGQQGSGRRTLFQDMFGKSALADTTVPVEPSVAPTITEGAISVDSVFTTSSYLAPPLASLYSTLMSNLLVPVGHHGRDAEDVAEGKDEDGDLHMDVDVAEVDKWDAGASRRVTPREVEGLVSLFGKDEFTSE